MNLSMRFSAPVFNAACQASVEALKLDRPADGVLSAFFRRHPKLGQQHRAAVAETVFAILRRKRLLQHVAPGVPIRDLVLACWTVLLGANLRELEGLAPHSSLEMLAEAKRKAHEALPLAVECDLPDWLIERLLPRFGSEGLRSLAAGLLQPAPLDLRVNLLKLDRDQAHARLASSGIEAARTPYSPAGLRLRGKPALNRHPLFLEGAVEVQDEGSQLLCWLVAPRRGEMNVDFCAGAGGKTLALGMLMHSAGRLYAYDISAARLAKLRGRVARSGLSNVHVQRIEREKDVRLSRLAGKIDRVLVDAPCSGLGTLRRNPDLKWRQTPEAVEEMRVKQRSILSAASKLVKPGGRLVYATCSLLREENQAVVEAFLAEHPQFSLRPAGQVLSEEHIDLEAGDYLELWPHVHGTDGFFAAILERAGR
jgi:16S rRNA (cytosine967-C5)-methyltransferase